MEQKLQDLVLFDRSKEMLNVITVLALLQKNK